MAFMKIAECTFHKFRMKSLLTIDEGLDGGGGGGGGLVFTVH